MSNSFGELFRITEFRGKPWPVRGSDHRRLSGRSAFEEEDIQTEVTRRRPIAGAGQNSQGGRRQGGNSLRSFSRDILPELLSACWFGIKIWIRASMRR